MGIAGSLNDAGSRTMEVKSFPPNDYGLYDMAGNVVNGAGCLQTVTETQDDFMPFRGNVFKDMKKNMKEQIMLSLMKLLTNAGYISIFR